MGISSGFTPTTPSSANPAKTFAIPVCASGGKEDCSGGKEDCGACWVLAPASVAAGGVAKLNAFAGFDDADEAKKNEFEFELEEEEVL